jgi:hypothetical protein
MTRRSICLSAFLMLVFLPSFGSQDGVNANHGLQSKSQTVSRRGRASHAAMAAYSRMANNPAPPATQIGFLSATQTAAGGGTFPSFPATTGDFNGDGFADAAAIVNTSTVPSKPVYNIAAELNNGKGAFTTVLTPTGAVEQDPIFAGNLSGHANGEDDVLIVHPAAAPLTTTIEGWVSNGDGTFTSKGTTAATTNGFVWAALADVNGDGILDVVVADAASPNGNICTLLGLGGGTFGTKRCVAIVGALNAGSPSGVPGNPIVFADFNGDGFLDFAAPAATTNQLMVYLNDKTGGYLAPTALSTPDSAYDSCFLGGGDLNGDGKDELVSANCIDNNITIYVNNGSGGFATGVYYAVDSNPIGVTVADVNHDGHNDVISSCSRSADIKVSLGNGDGTVQNPSVGYVTGGSPLVPPLVAAFHGDSTKPDVVVPDDEFSFVYLEGYGDGSFRSAVNYYATPGGGFEAQAVNIATGDFNGDGIPDFVIGNVNAPKFSNAGITVFLSNSDGTLQLGVNYYNAAKTNYSLQYVAVADFNGDGKLDIAVTDNFNSVVQIFTGNGNGTFTAGATYATDVATGAGPLGLIVGDFNGDGKPDLAVINNHGTTSANVGILLNTGSAFSPVVNYPLSVLATEITAADVNGDKKLDLVVPLYGTNAAPGSAVAILLGNGNGTFQAEKDVKLINGANTYLNPYDAAIGDLNGDGKVDLAVTIEDQTNLHQGIAVALGNGDGTFQTPTLLASTMQNPALDVPLPGYVKIVDMNQDGIPDMVYSNSQFSTVGILYGKGAGAFSDPVEFPADRWAWGLALVDLNKDGGTDVVVSGNSLDFSGVAVLFNSGGNKATVSSSANPSTPGAAVTLSATVVSTVKGVSAIPTGNVTFKDGSATLGSAALNSSGVASFVANSLADGPHSITAQYPGDVNFLPTVAPVYDQSVGKADGMVSVNLGAVPNPSVPGQSVTFTATVTDTVTGEPFVPTGKVTFNDGGTALGAVTLNSAGMAVFSSSTLAGGTHPITGAYSGDANFAAKTSTPLNQVVAAPSYSIAATPTTQTVNPGTSATYKITTTITNGYNGTVSFPASACSGLPTGATCSFSPSSITGAGSTTLTITTTAPTAALMVAPALTPANGSLNLWASLGSLGFVGMVLAGDWSSRKRRRFGIVLAVLAVMFLITLVGCGGGSSTSPGGGGGGGGTPAGTSSVQVTVTGTAGTNGGSTTPTGGPLKLTLVVN